MRRDWWFMASGWGLCVRPRTAHSVAGSGAFYALATFARRGDRVNLEFSPIDGEWLIVPRSKYAEGGKES
jgi:hypothetical protein